MYKRSKKIVKCGLLIGLTLALLFPAFCLEAKSTGATGMAVLATATSQLPAVVSTLVVSQREIDLGTVAMGQEKEETFTLRSIGGEALSWTIASPEAWFPLDRSELAGTATASEDTFILRITAVKREDIQDAMAITANLPVQLTLVSRSQSMTCVRDLPVGYHRDSFQIHTHTGTRRTVFFKFNLVPKTEDASLSVFPARLDLGELKQGEAAVRRIALSNRSDERVRWQISLAPPAKKTAARTNIDRYISFQNEEVSGKGTYAVPTRLDSRLQLWGAWHEEQGYPAVTGRSVLKLNFYGSSLAVFLKKTTPVGQFAAYIDNELVKTYEYSEMDQDREFYEITVLDNMTEANHVLTLALNGGSLVVEGVRIKRRDVQEGLRQWITIFPDSGFTFRETDYIKITANLDQALPGIYSNIVNITSNNGNIALPVSYEIVGEVPGKRIDIYRYHNAGKYLYITDEPSEERRLTSRGFVKQGLAFSLFAPDTLGTSDFHRWYSPQNIDHFYSHDLNKGNKMPGYIYEGVVGHIATSRLSKTRELYRWRNPRTGQHFYTLDARGEGMNRRGYVFDGIAGYVK